MLREQRIIHTVTRLDAKIPPLNWIDITDNARLAGFNGLGRDTTVTFYFHNDVEKEHIAIITLNNAENAVTQAMYKYISPCPADSIHLSNFVIGENDSECFGATNHITIQDVTVDSGGSLTLIAGNYIAIASEFNVALNGYFHACISDEFCTLPPQLLASHSIMPVQPEMESTEHSAQALRIFPNPTSGEFTIDLGKETEGSPTTIIIYNMIGEIILKEEADSNLLRYSLAGYPTGIYVILIMNSETSVNTLIYTQ
ncbi:MAG: T9SS type A sorting domain-containing protein [Bacteroidales bacterium]|nr:T9SS type A sorting domain-containing protein [Bacteroidales bacterium]